MSNIEQNDEPAKIPAAEEIAKCKRCDEPAVAGSRFCSDHQPPPTASKKKKKASPIRFDFIVGIALLLGTLVWAYTKMPSRSSGDDDSKGNGGRSASVDKGSNPLLDKGDASTNRNTGADSHQAAAPVAAPAGVVPERASASGHGTCGNGVVETGEQCDGQALAGATCVSLGFSGDCGPEEGCVHPGLTCLHSCRFDYSGCTAETQTASQRFVDQHNGTAIDRLTGLTWELKCTDTGCTEPHDVLTTRPWAGAAAQWIGALNEENFGGHNDWRLPTLEELRSLLVAVPPCPTEPCPGSALPRRLTAGGAYWSSTSFSVDKHRAWAISFRDGDVYTAEKREALHVRAVRNGS